MAHAGLECARGVFVGGWGELGGRLVLAAAVAAIFDLVPDALPLFAPSEGSAAGDADFGGEVLFFDSFHGGSMGEGSEGSA